MIAAETICDIHDVLIIELDAAIAETVKSRLNVSVLNEDGTNPRNLEYAISTHEADIIISTLRNDASNLFVCMYSKLVRPDIRTIASIGNPDYMIGTSESSHSGVDVLISPDIITANKMYRLAVLENAIDYEYVQSLGLAIAIFAVEKWHPIVGKVVMDIPTEGDFTIFGIYRDGILNVDVDTLEIYAGDRICVIGNDDGMAKFNTAIGVETVSREFTILGGSVLGKNLAQLLLKDTLRRYVKIIEKDPLKCIALSKELEGVNIINADFTEPEVQAQESIFKCDCTISTSRMDDTNLLMCMSAQKNNASKIISRYFKKEYEDIFRFTGLESIVGYHKVVSNEIIKCTVSDEMAIVRLNKENEVFIEHRIGKGSKLKDEYLGDLRVPAGVRIVAVFRDDDIIYPRMDTRFVEGDRVIVFTDMLKKGELSKFFGKNIASE